MSSTVIDEMQAHAKRIASGMDAQVKPGQPARFSEACAPGDSIRQGDLYLDIVESIPKDFVKVEKPTDVDKQLVPGNTQGAKHCLSSLIGVTLYRPKDWNEESLVGPAFVSTKEVSVLHPTHGHVIVPAGTTVACNYQREWSKEEARERRARD